MLVQWERFLSLPAPLNSLGTGDEVTAADQVHETHRRSDLMPGE